MNVNECLYVGDDSFTLKTPEDWVDTNRVYEVTGAPRCTPVPHWFVHNETILVFGLQGSFAFEIDDRIYMLEKDGFLYIPAESKYRLRGKERGISKLHVYAPTTAVEDSWREVAVAVKEQQRRTR